MEALNRRFVVKGSNHNPFVAKGFLGIALSACCAPLRSFRDQVYTHYPGSCTWSASRAPGDEPGAHLVAEAFRISDNNDNIGREISPRCIVCRHTDREALDRALVLRTRT